MATTQYNIFCRYLNKKTNQAVTNKTPIQWINAEEYDTLHEFYKANEDHYKKLNYVVIHGGARIKNTMDATEEWEEDIHIANQKHVPWLIGKLAQDAFSLCEQEVYNKCTKYLKIEQLLKDGKAVKELCRVEPADTTEEKTKEMMEREIGIYNEILEQAYVKNPKFDMVFAYDGIAKTVAEKADYNKDAKEVRQKPYAYYDKMRRFELDPWFFYSAHGSLADAMRKAEDLVNMFGKDAVCICKVVPLDQYIDIV